MRRSTELPQPFGRWSLPSNASRSDLVQAHLVQDGLRPRAHFRHTCARRPDLV